MHSKPLFSIRHYDIMSFFHTTLLNVVLNPSQRVYLELAFCMSSLGDGVSVSGLTFAQLLAQGESAARHQCIPQIGQQGVVVCSPLQPL